jgi:glycosyltransferase involved in cell wall biosynthesis
MTLVSVITPSLNQAQFLPQTLNSVLDQDHPALEYLVVDGGSSDGSVEIIRRHADRLAWWVSEADAGQADAINKGLAHAHGEIVAWLNSDDYYLPGAVSAAVRALDSSPEAAFVYGNVKAVDARDQVINVMRYPQVSLRDLLCFTIIGQPAVFIRRKALDAAGGLDARFHLLLDHQLWIRLAAAGSVTHVNETWAGARSHPAAKNTAQAGLFGAEALKILEWASNEPRLASELRLVQRRAQASAHRVDARYLLDAGLPARSVRAWLETFRLHPGTALKRLNIVFSALLQLSGLGALRRVALEARKRQHQRRS